ncbi:MAG TPA: outer membrane lipoprotein carrier protein LolA [Alphaproteobacteria bacterium]|nr:outer membrane lipoprotein carrier protein LolA [Alphaproteobacteria bacterium]
MPHDIKPSKRIAALLGAALVATLALGASSVARAEGESRLSAADRADVARIEAYLNSIKTVSARFLQTSSGGNVVQGTFDLERPGKMRVQYDPPDPLLMIASGIWLTVYDPELKQTSYLPIDSTPAYFLVKNKIDPQDVTVTKVERGADSLRVTLHEAGHPDQGRLTLVFSDKPLQLEKWTVIDATGKTIDVALLNPRFDQKIDPDAFKFVDPSPMQPGRQ